MSDDEPGVEMPTEVELVSLETLTPYANNPKRHPSDQVDKIASSILNYGFDQPIVIDGDGEIIKGHGRYQAAQQLGLESVPVLWRNGLTPTQVKAARIADNKTQIESGFDYDTLAVEMETLNESNDLPAISELTGFDTVDVDDLLDRSTADIEDFMAQPDRDTSEDTGSSSDDADPTDDGELGDDTFGGEGTTETEGVEPAAPRPREVACPECGHEFTHESAGVEEDDTTDAAEAEADD